MQFNSYSYLLLLLVSVLLFWNLPVRFRHAYVLILSILFYASWNVYFLIIPLVMCVIVFWSSSKIREGGSAGQHALWAGIGAIVAILGVFKYGHFVAENLSTLGSWLGLEPLPLAWRLALPLGISFYSFEAISYLLDTRQGRVKSASFRDLFLFIMFWPHLIAGPIVRTRELIPQLKFDKPFESRFVFSGLDRLLLGLVQKNLIANTIGGWVDEGFLPKAAALNTTIDNWALAVAFGIQIYFDFAAYTNMAIGAAQMIGITLPENFRFPYHAANPVDFWSRWHMTLSRWIRDYVFFPQRRISRQEASPLCQPGGCHGCRRTLAWRCLGIRPLGHHARSLSGLLSSIRELERRTDVSAACIANGLATDHSLCGCSGVGTLPGGFARAGDGHAQIDVRKFLLRVFLLCKFLLNGAHLVCVDRA
jgi:alginate O-acetyltransferase complex protein AlgI